MSGSPKCHWTCQVSKRSWIAVLASAFLCRLIIVLYVVACAKGHCNNARWNLTTSESSSVAGATIMGFKEIVSCSLASDFLLPPNSRIRRPAKLEHGCASSDACSTCNRTPYSAHILRCIKSAADRKSQLWDLSDSTLVSTAALISKLFRSWL